MQPMRSSLTAGATVNSIGLLKLYLVSVSNLHVQVKQAHWNVKNLGSEPLNIMFGKIAAEIAFLANRIEEYAIGFGIANTPRDADVTRRHFLNLHPRGISDAQYFAFAIYGALAVFSQSMRHASGHALEFGDPETANLFAEVSGAIEDLTRILEAHITST
ncbi:MAG: ferritin-like domain-containing protein [Alphaproteobacteria bacterium]